MFFIKKWLQVSLMIAVFFAGAIQAHAEDLGKTVKDAYQQPNDKVNKAESKDLQSKNQASNPDKVGITVWEFIRMIFATIFVVVLLYILLKFINKKNKSYQRANSVENLGGTSLGSNRSVQLVKVGGRILVVGVGENIQLLKEIDDASEYEQLLKDHNNKLDQMLQPGALAMKLKNKWLKKSESEPASFSSEFKNQLDQMSVSRKKLLSELDRKGRDDE
ncbi:flagellar biosynthesis protein FliZ [Peribacillus muralis]|uniref:flagellar biosynthetic protein FliO n=1 Tax=Peribacillus muralis TaxID=264697 RepID=UPI001F4E0DB8|nr:flagellar biosynthetic protein FliO [Peribacillus muralis]MCK1992467.1 flagellar biosynthetic protein FliO [Peribacillus muralis]MCK2013023.1 flagellar biosynthetic protein FliO [Peribacillus muralis]